MKDWQEQLKLALIEADKDADDWGELLISTKELIKQVILNALKARDDEWLQAIEETDFRQYAYWSASKIGRLKKLDLIAYEKIILNNTTKALTTLKEKMEGK